MIDIILRRAALAALVMTSSACAVARWASTSMDPTACDAIAAAIDSLVIGSHGGRAGLMDWTRPARDEDIPPYITPGTGWMPELDSTTLRSFREHNVSALPMCAALPLVGGWMRIAKRDLDALPQDTRYWTAFGARFPGVMGVTSTSGVGIGKDGRQALLVLDHSCSGLCGAGHIVLLERDDEGKWRVKRAKMTWIS